MERNLELLEQKHFDLLIIGGGITGAGVALDAASRGLQVALVEKNDFASATSSASSKLVHGGLRYLEYGQFRLVYEALSERRILLQNAPHLVKPLRFILPFYRGSRLPAWKGRVGLWCYDLLTGSQNLQHSRRVSPIQLQRSFPSLVSKNLLGGAEYYDAQMDDARLCLEVLSTAWQKGAKVANYLRVTGLETVNQRIQGAWVHDPFTDRTFLIRASRVLNATGPWVDAIVELAGGTRKPNYLQPTKGVHIILDGKPFAEGGSLLSRETAFTLLHPMDGRVFFVMPWMGRTLIGTTDTFTDQSADLLTVTPEEEKYLLDGYNAYFQPTLHPEAIRGRFAGLRPLLKSSPHEPSARSREYRILDGPNGLVSVAGGKWTTYRHMAEVITDTVLDHLGDKRPCTTRSIPLIGTPSGSWQSFMETEPSRLSTQQGIDLELAKHLVYRYGKQAEKVIEYIRGSEKGWDRIIPNESDVRGEWDFQRAEEMAMNREDHLLRRSRIGMWHEELFG
jgi:glycerol-3-phosphate dehydrogenase